MDLDRETQAPLARRVIALVLLQHRQRLQHVDGIRDSQVGQVDLLPRGPVPPTAQLPELGYEQVFSHDEGVRLGAFASSEQVSLEQLAGGPCDPLADWHPCDDLERVAWSTPPMVN
jgi:hypothetical protein